MPVSMPTAIVLGACALLAACELEDKDEPVVDGGERLDAPVGSPDARTLDAPIDAPAGNAGFPVPTAITKANTFTGGAWTEVGDADWSCLGTPSPDQPSTQPLMLSGKIRDFQTTSNGVGGATVTAFAGTMLGGNLGTAMSDTAPATKGNYSLALAQLPAGQRRHGFRIDATSYMRTYVLNQYLDPAVATHTRDLLAVSVGTANAIIAFVGEQFDPMTGTVAGSFRDCQGRAVSNAVVTVSSTPGVIAHLPGVETFYFSASSASLPVRHNVAPTMNKDGLFVVIDAPPQAAPAFVQIWGFRTIAELAAGTLTLLAELPTPVEGNAVITGSFEPRRS
jgi:hypothetical protein